MRITTYKCDRCGASVPMHLLLMITIGGAYFKDVCEACAAHIKKEMTLG